MRFIEKNKISSLLAVSLLLSPTISSAESSDWDFMVEAYFLASAIEGDAGTGRVTDAEIDISFSDIWDHLELGGMAHAEAFYKNKWGVILDYGFMDLNKVVKSRNGGVLEGDLRQGVMEAFLSRRFALEKGHIDLYGGIRWWENEVNLDINPAIIPGSLKVDIKEDWVDPVIGARWLHPVSDDWTVLLRADVGGFGVASDSTWLLAAGAQYKINESWHVDMQYKALWVDYEDGTPGEKGYFAYDTVTHGPLLGIAYNF